MKALCTLVIILSFALPSRAQRDIDFFEPDFDTSYCRHYNMYFQEIGAQNTSPHYWPMPYHISQFISKSASRYHIKTIEKRMTESETAYTHEFQTYDDKGRLVMLKTISKSKHSEKIDTLFEKYVYSNDNRKITVFSIVHDRDTILARNIYFDQHMAVIKSDIITDTSVNGCTWSSKYTYDNLGLLTQVTEEEINCRSAKRTVVYDATNSKRSYTLDVDKAAAPGADTTLINYFRIDNTESGRFLYGQLNLAKPLSGTVSTSNPRPPDPDENGTKNTFSNFIHLGTSDVFGINHMHTSDSAYQTYNCDVSVSYYKWDKTGRIQYYYSGRYLKVGSANSTPAAGRLMYGYELYDATKHSLTSSRHDYDIATHRRNNEKAKQLTTTYTTYPNANLPQQVNLDKKYTYTYTFYK